MDCHLLICVLDPHLVTSWVLWKWIPWWGFVGRYLSGINTYNRKGVKAEERKRNTWTSVHVPQCRSSPIWELRGSKDCQLEQPASDRNGQLSHQSHGQISPNHRARSWPCWGLEAAWRPNSPQLSIKSFLEGESKWSISMANISPQQKALLPFTRKRFGSKIKSHFSESSDPKWLHYNVWEHWGHQTQKHLEQPLNWLAGFQFLPSQVQLANHNEINFHETPLSHHLHAQKRSELPLATFLRLILYRQESLTERIGLPSLPRGPLHQILSKLPSIGFWLYHFHIAPVWTPSSIVFSW